MVRTEWRREGGLNLSNRLSKTRIDKLGERLKDPKSSDDDLRILDEYRRTFGKAYETVVSTLRRELRLEPTGRPAKTIPSLRAKLRRESIRLTQMQDIAGCRLVVPDVVDQDMAVRQICGLFADSTVIDRRARRATAIVPCILWWPLMKRMSKSRSAPLCSMFGLRSRRNGPTLTLASNTVRVFVP